MKQLRYTIRSQVLGFALLTCASVLLPVGGGLLLLNYQQTQTRLTESLASTARITAANVAVALAFGDKDSATETLKALRFDPLITSATIQEPQHRVFACFQNHPSDPTSTTTDPYVTEVPIAYDGVTYGHLEVSGNIHAELRRAAVTWGGACAAAFLLAGTAVFFIARRFQRQVSVPITDLAATALRVAHERDFAARSAVPVNHCSEISQLAIALNIMLSEIARRDAHLARQVTELNREIEERETAEEALRDNHHAMNRLAREAGMAEVASGVIHNIGNTLTSISISSDLVATRLANASRRPIATLGKLLDPASPHTATVFTAHPDGPELRTLLNQLTTTLGNDLEETDRLVSILQAGNSHLKQIVATQQSLARNRQLIETFELNEALQEALVLARTLSRHNTPIEECPHDDTEIYADRSLVIQILLNLLINAHDAIGTHAPAAPLITLCIGPAHAGLLPITVTDNGEGIDADKLLSIFTYGYTTKASGNGFGLHNSANAARMMGGELCVSSPGLGLGATFTLRLPTAKSDPIDHED